ncbi:hypothetical protein AVEN_119082-1 [Araneus ventricosus]|uniref:Uncharacterized protein n=1 Tax=Araneus ventricosus TaxID=182803 RepID=A0A4Y2BL59_ARAVE|nr:hypothetical protein AVEN_119082-1 [Araneus ventricosus]
MTEGVCVVRLGSPWSANVFGVRPQCELGRIVTRKQFLLQLVNYNIAVQRYLTSSHHSSVGREMECKSVPGHGLVEITSCPSSQFSRIVFTSHSEENLDPDKYLEPRLGAESEMLGVAPNFPLELLQQLLSFASGMGIVMQEDDTITQYARAFTSDNFMMAQILFPFSEIEGTLIWNTVLFRA